jgi:hypothetical protein
VFNLEKCVCGLKEQRELAVRDYYSQLKRGNAKLRSEPIPVYEELRASFFEDRTIPENVPACLFSSRGTFE